MSVELTDASLDFDFSLSIQDTDEMIEAPKIPETLLKGKIIVIEGIDGAGKTIQTELLEQDLKERGYDVLCVNFPEYNNNFFGKIIGQYLTGQFGNPTDVDPYCSAILYASDRMESRNVIREHVKKGGIVILNRYVQSNLAYNAAKMNSVIMKTKLIEYIEKLEYDTNNMPKADVVIYLDVDTNISQGLIEQKELRDYIVANLPTIDSNNSVKSSSATPVGTPVGTPTPKREVSEVDIEIPVIDLGEPEPQPEPQPDSEQKEDSSLKDEYEKNVDFQKLVRKEYLDFCKSRRDKWIRISCVIDGKMDTTARIHAKVFSMMCRMLLHQRHKGTEKSGMYVSRPTDKELPSLIEVDREEKKGLIDRLRNQRKEIERNNIAFGRGNMSIRQQQEEEEREKAIRQRELLKKMNIEKKEKEKQQVKNRKNELLKRVENLKRKGLKNSTPSTTSSSVPKPEIKCYVLPKEVIERTRKTDNLLESIFGSSEYVRDIYYFFLQKYGYPDLPNQFKVYFRALMQHYFENDVVLYQEDETMRGYLHQVILFDEDDWKQKIPLLYRQYKIAMKQVNPVSRRWFPEEIIMLSSIFRHYIRFGDVEFIPIKLDFTRLASIYVNQNPLRSKFQKVYEYMKTHNTVKTGVIQINL